MPYISCTCDKNLGDIGRNLTKCSNLREMKGSGEILEILNRHKYKDLQIYKYKNVYIYKNANIQMKGSWEIWEILNSVRHYWHPILIPILPTSPSLYILHGRFLDPIIYKIIHIWPMATQMHKCIYITQGTLFVLKVNVFG